MALTSVSVRMWVYMCVCVCVCGMCTAPCRQYCTDRTFASAARSVFSEGLPASVSGLIANSAYMAAVVGAFAVVFEEGFEGGAGPL